METPLRSLTKSALWSLIGLVTMALVGLAFTGSLAVGGVMALINTAIGFLSYLVYERLWSRVRWGRRDV